MAVVTGFETGSGSVTYELVTLPKLYNPLVFLPTNEMLSNSRSSPGGWDRCFAAVGDAVTAALAAQTGK